MLEEAESTRTTTVHTQPRRNHYNNLKLVLVEMRNSRTKV